MDNSFLKAHAERCRSLAAKADEFTRKRLLDLASRYDATLISGPTRVANVPRVPPRPASELPWSAVSGPRHSSIVSIAASASSLDLRRKVFVQPAKPPSTAWLLTSVSPTIRLREAIKNAIDQPFNLDRNRGWPGQVKAGALAILWSVAPTKKGGQQRDCW